MASAVEAIDFAMCRELCAAFRKEKCTGGSEEVGLENLEMCMCAELV